MVDKVNNKGLQFLVWQNLTKYSFVEANSLTVTVLRKVTKFKAMVLIDKGGKEETKKVIQ